MAPDGGDPAALVSAAGRPRRLHGPRTAAAPTGTIGPVAVTDPLSVAIGAHASLYVLDQTHILHFSGSGQLLGQLGPADRGTTIATDRTGDLYYVRQERLVELAPTGRILRHWPIGDVAFLTVDRQGQVYATSASATGPGGLRTRVQRYAATGRLLSHWTTPYGAMLAAGRDGYLYGIGPSAPFGPARRSAPDVLSTWQGATGERHRCPARRTAGGWCAACSGPYGAASCQGLAQSRYRDDGRG